MAARGKAPARASAKPADTGVLKDKGSENKTVITKEVIGDQKDGFPIVGIGASAGGWLPLKPFSRECPPIKTRAWPLSWYSTWLPTTRASSPTSSAATLGLDAALEEIGKNRGILYDPGGVDACLKLFREKQYRFVEA